MQEKYLKSREKSNKKISGKITTKITKNRENDQNPDSRILFEF